MILETDGLPLKMRIHPAANIFPMMNGVAFEEFVEDIRVNGLRDKIEVFDSQLIDGRNRLRALHILGVHHSLYVKVIPLSKSFDPVLYVISKNLHRRHLEKSQLAMVGARMKELYANQAKERQGKRNDIKNIPANLPECGDARDKAGKAVGVSGKSIDVAAKIISSGNQEVIDAVDTGKMTIHAASKVVLPPKACASPKPKQKQFDVLSATDRVCEWLRSELDKWPEEHRKTAAHWIRQILKVEFEL